ncbi:MAG: alpha/beta fold hydrolase [Bacteroidetes bacterium]|nr:MAG: alpha/beta fold hydrolase [Bacteroidota bacterium]
MKPKFMHVNARFSLLPAACMLVWLCAACQQQQPAPPIREGLLQSDGAELYYKRMGKGEPILLVHGGPGLDHSYLLPQMGMLAQHYELIFYDQRACGRSSVEVDTSSISISQFVRDLEAVRQMSGHERIHLLGHSWGGLLAMYYAIAHPQRLKSLILLNPMSPSHVLKAKEDSLLNAHTTPEEMAAINEIMQSPAFQQQQIPAYEALFREFFRREFYDKRLADSLSLHFQPTFVQGSRLLQHLGKDLASYELRPQLGSISCPTLIIYGQEETGGQVAAPALQAAMPQARLLMFERCGHFPYIERPELLRQSLSDFLQTAN